MKKLTKNVVLDTVFEHNDKFYQITTPSLRLGKDIYTAAEAAANPEVAAKLVEIGAKNIVPYFDAEAEKADAKPATPKKEKAKPAEADENENNSQPSKSE